MLYREQTFAPRAFHSELQQQTNTVSTVNTQKIPPWACGLGCAEACAERFSALKGRGGVRLWGVAIPKNRSVLQTCKSLLLCRFIEFKVSIIFSYSIYRCCYMHRVSCLSKVWQTLSNITQLAHQTKTAVLNWFRRRSFTVLNSSVSFGTWVERRMNRLRFSEKSKGFITIFLIIMNNNNI